MNCVTAITPSDAARPRAMLHELAELTLELAREVQRQAIRQAQSAEPDAATTAGLLFTRVARTLRQILALDARIATSEQAGTATERARRAAADRRRTSQARLELRRRLADSVHADTTLRDTDALLRDLDDRLHDDDIDAALATDHLTDIVIALCAEFGLKPDLSYLSDDDLARLGSRPLESGSATLRPPPAATFLNPD